MNFLRKELSFLLAFVLTLQIQTGSAKYNQAVFLLALIILYGQLYLELHWITLGINHFVWGIGFGQ